MSVVAATSAVVLVTAVPENEYSELYVGVSLYWFPFQEPSSNFIKAKSDPPEDSQDLVESEVRGHVESSNHLTVDRKLLILKWLHHCSFQQIPPGLLASAVQLSPKSSSLLLNLRTMPGD